MKLEKTAKQQQEYSDWHGYIFGIYAFVGSIIFFYMGIMYAKSDINPDYIPFNVFGFGLLLIALVLFFEPIIKKRNSKKGGIFLKILAELGFLSLVFGVIYLAIMYTVNT